MHHSLRTLILVALAAAPTLVTADQAKMEGERQKLRNEVVQALSRMPHLENQFDDIEFVVSGPVVELRGFVTNSVLKGDAENAVKKLAWVSHVVNLIEELPNEPTMNELRRKILQMLTTACPDAFPQDHAYIRIKVDKDYVVTLVGFVQKMNEKRLEAAVVQIKQLPLVKDVQDNVVVSK